MECWMNDTCIFVGDPSSSTLFSEQVDDDQAFLLDGLDTVLGGGSGNYSVLCHATVSPSDSREHLWTKVPDAEAQCGPATRTACGVS